jgi:hypothetical protein
MSDGNWLDKKLLVQREDVSSSRLALLATLLKNGNLTVKTVEPHAPPIWVVHTKGGDTQFARTTFAPGGLLGAFVPKKVVVPFVMKNKFEKELLGHVVSLLAT